jgi:hypothetical protein
MNVSRASRRRARKTVMADRSNGVREAQISQWRNFSGIIPGFSAVNALFDSAQGVYCGMNDDAAGAAGHFGDAAFNAVGMLPILGTGLSVAGGLWDGQAADRRAAGASPADAPLMSEAISNQLWDWIAD